MTRRVKRFCSNCKKQLSKNCKGAFCNHCRDRTGSKNPFYGKVHTKETIDTIKAKNSIASKKLWTRPDYINAVIKGISKPRREGFKAEQSKRIKNWYKNNPEQRKLRSLKMSETWATGKLEISNKNNIKHSKLELELATILQNEFKNRDVTTKNLIKITNKLRYYPDILIDDVLAVEFMGDYFHMNPSIFKETDFNKKLKLTAKEIWERDCNRREILTGSKYVVCEVWESDYKADINKVLEKIKNSLAGADWEFCY